MAKGMTMSSLPATQTKQGMPGLIDVIQRLSLARDVASVQEIVRHAARNLTGADGATFVLRDGDRCYYADEDAIAPLWKGQRFPLQACISGWAMLHREPVVIEDIYADDRIPHDAYRPTFVKSLVMVPIRTLDPIGAIGNYWANQRRPHEDEVKLLQALADTTAVALENVHVFQDLEQRVKQRTAQLEAANQQLEKSNQELLAAQQQADRVFAAYAKALPGTILDGKYRLDRELGTGGYGAVYQGWHLILQCPIAVKVFRPVLGNDSALDLKRFLREGAAAARLNHPNAVQVWDSGVSSEGVAYLIMELLRGRTLAQELEAEVMLSLTRCGDIACAVADVLAIAHQSGILHRDIKPENVFLHQENGIEVVKVVDFGIAKFFGDSTSDAFKETLTRTGECLGTPTFVAPERILGRTEDGRSDVFSLGAMLYKMICGVSPWTPQQQLELIEGKAKILKPKPMRSYRGDVTADLEAFVGRALALNAHERPDAEEFAAGLEQLVYWDNRPAEPTAAARTATAVGKRPQSETTGLTQVYRDTQSDIVEQT
jgi:tRNA A-37 threonylcarbamoyl transferase component Bud32